MLTVLFELIFGFIDYCILHIIMYDYIALYLKIIQIIKCAIAADTLSLYL